MITVKINNDGKFVAGISCFGTDTTIASAAYYNRFIALDVTI